MAVPEQEAVGPRPARIRDTVGLPPEFGPMCPRNWSALEARRANMLELYQQIEEATAAIKSMSRSRD